MPPIEKITTIPEGSERWMKQNANRVKGWKQVPMFIKETPKYLKPLLTE